MGWTWEVTWGTWEGWPWEEPFPHTILLTPGQFKDTQLWQKMTKSYFESDKNCFRPPPVALEFSDSLARSRHRPAPQYRRQNFHPWSPISLTLSDSSPQILSSIKDQKESKKDWIGRIYPWSVTGVDINLKNCHLPTNICHICLFSVKTKDFWVILINLAIKYIKDASLISESDAQIGDH